MSAARDGIDLQRVERVLVTMLRHHGDVLLITPLLGALKQRHPRFEIDALVYADTAPMLLGHPALAQVHCIDRRWRAQGLLAQARGVGALLRRLRQRRYDLTIHLTTHWFGAWMNRVLRPRHALAPDFQKEKRSGRLWRGSFTHFFPYRAGAHKHMVEKHLDALRFLGVEPDDAAARLLLRPTEADYAKARRLLDQAGLREGGYIAVHPTSRWLSKCWSEAAMAQVLDHLDAKGWPAVLTAAPQARELEMAQRILAACRRARPLDLTGALTLPELAALIDLAALHLGVDSAPMHIAAAMQTPGVALFGQSDPAEWGPWKAPHRALRAAPGERVEAIPVAAVVQAVDEMLARAA